MALHNNFDLQDPYLLNQKNAKEESGSLPKNIVPANSVTSIKRSPTNSLNKDLNEWQKRSKVPKLPDPNSNSSSTLELPTSSVSKSHILDVRRHNREFKSSSSDIFNKLDSSKLEQLF